MANIIKAKRSAVPGKVPATTDLALGEIGINTYDGKAYIKKDVGGVESIVALGGTGSGDVTGPNSATDNAVTRFDTASGKAIQNSTVTLDDNGNLGNVNAVGFDTTPGTLPTAAGAMFWDSGNGTPSIILDADVTLQLGQEQLALVYNGTGATIQNGKVVAVTGAQGARPSVALADADSEALSASTLGIATEEILNGAEGFVTTFGFVRGLDTSAFTAGAPVYLSQTAGSFTATRPSAPAHTVALGWVIKVSASAGEIFVNINNGWELGELHDVLLSSVADNQALIYNAASSTWKNTTLKTVNGNSLIGSGNIAIPVGDVVGPASATDNAIARFNGSTGKLIKNSNGTIDDTGNASLASLILTTDLAVAHGGTGASDAAGARANLGAQETLVSGTNIKTINGTTLLGSGNIVIPVGDVVGPSSATDNAIARFDSTTGKLIQNSGATIDDSGNLTAATFIASGTTSVVLPSGTSAQRDAVGNGKIRYNTSIARYEVSRTGGVWNYLQERPLYRYMRYVCGGAINGHHPRVARLYYINDAGSRVNFVVFAGDNCSDTGAIPTDGQSWSLDLGAGAQEVGRGLGGYVSYAGARAAYVSLQGSNDNSAWATIFTTAFSASSCGFYDYYNPTF